MAKDEKKGLFAGKNDKNDVKAAPKKDNKPAKKEAKSNRRGPIRYMRDVIQELKKVTWPTRKELINATLAVIVFVVVFTLVIWLMDLALTPAFQWMIK